MENSEDVVSKIDYYTPQIAVSTAIGPRGTVACVVGGGEERRGDLDVSPGATFCCLKCGEESPRYDRSAERY